MYSGSSEKKLQSNVDHRVSMLAAAVNSAVSKRKSLAVVADNFHSSGSSSRQILDKSLAPVTQQQLSSSVQTNRTGSEIVPPHIQEPVQSPWQPFAADDSAENNKVSAFSVYSAPSQKIETPPQPPPLPPLFHNAVAKNQPAIVAPDKIETTVEQVDTQELLQNGPQDVSTSIGTQTDKTNPIQTVEPKPPKMKTKSLQIDFPDSGITKVSSSIFKRTRSITPTRYRTRNENHSKERKTRSVSANQKQKKLSKSSSKEKLLADNKKEEKRQPPYLTRHRENKKPPHHSKSNIKLNQPIKVLIPRIEPQLKEIVARVTPEQKEDKPSTDKLQKKKKVDDTKTKAIKTKEKTQPAAEEPKSNEKSGEIKTKKRKTTKVKSSDNLDRETEESEKKNSQYKSSKLKGLTTRQDESAKKKEQREDKSKPVEGSREDKSSLKEPEDQRPSEAIDLPENATPDRKEKTDCGKRVDGPRDARGDNKTLSDEVKEKPTESGVKTTINMDDKNCEELKEELAANGSMERNTDKLPVKDEDIESIKKAGKVDVETGSRLGLVNDRENADRMLPADDDQPPREMDYLEDVVAAADESALAVINPELIKQTEEQIFAKIKYYKEVLDGVKDKPWTLRKKITMLREAREYTAKFEGKLSKSGEPGRIARLKVAYSKTSRELSNFAALLVPWEGRIKHIESYFGSVVASYFTFLRWIFWTNIIQAAIIGGVIIAPEVLFGPDWGSVDYKSVPANETMEASYLKTSWNFDGYVKYSPLFYGYYSSIRQFPSGYRMPLAYLIGNIGTFAYSFIAILRQIGANAKDEKASDKDDNFTFSWKTYANWDFMIGNSETARNKFKSIIVGIRESITEQKEAKKKISTKLKFLRILANFLVLLVLGGSTYAIILTVGRSQEFEERIKAEGPDSVSAWQRNEISVVMSLVTSLFPLLFDVIAGIEDYHPRVALKWSLYRILTLYLLNLYTLYFALYLKIQDIQEADATANATYYSQFNLTEVVLCTEDNFSSAYAVDKQLNSSGLETTPYYESTTPNITACVQPFGPDTTCWETMVGQELFKLTMFDMVTTIAMIYGTEFFRAVVIKTFNACWCWDLERNFPGYASFSLAENLLHLVYNQGMIWMGTLFSPGLPIFNLVKLLAMFYVRAWAVMVCNVPEERIFKAGSDNFYLLILLFMLYVVMLPIAFAMVNIPTSKICGPFRNVEYMSLALTEWMEEVLPAVINNVFRYLLSPGGLIPSFILLFLIINYLNSNNSALKGLVLDLKKQLNYERTEGKKKVFSMADGEGKTKKAKKDRTRKVPPSLTALRALNRMGAFKNVNSSPSLKSVEPEQQAINTPGNASFGVALTAAKFLGRLKRRANAATADGT